MKTKQADETGRDESPDGEAKEDSGSGAADADRTSDEDARSEEAADGGGEDKADEEPKSEVKKGKASHLIHSELREVLETSASGAPSSGEAVKDIFATDEIFHRILATADSEFSRSNRLLLLSGLMAGLSIGLTFLARVTFAGELESGASRFLENAFYPIGFIFIILGRQQLYTENTLTPVTLVLMRLSSIPRLLKLWGIVLFGNLAGATLAALFFATTDILNTDAVAAAIKFGAEALEHTWSSLFLRAVVAGFMVAGLVWLLHAVRESMVRLALIYLIFFLIPSTGLFHCIIGACEIAYYVFVGGTSVSTALLEFELPLILGNTAGGLLFVAIPNFFQTRGERFREWEQLSWYEWFRGKKELAGHEETEDDASTDEDDPKRPSAEMADDEKERE